MPSTEWKLVPQDCSNKFRCPSCREADIKFMTWESSDEAYEDTKYQCNSCGFSWWVESGD